MSDKKYYWLKLQNDFFSSKRIKKLRKLGSDFVIIYLKMQLLSLSNNGMLVYSGIEDTFADELALDIDEDVDKVQLTISYLQSCGLLEVTDDNDFFLPYVEKCTGSSASDEHTRESTRQRVAKFREKQKQLALGNVTETLQKRYSNVTCNGEIEKDIEKDIDKDKKIYNVCFEEFWKCYPRKKEKQKAYAQYKARLNCGYSEEELLTACKNYADECERTHREERYIKLGATFLSVNEPFADYLKKGETNYGDRRTHEERDREIERKISQLDFTDKRSILDL